MLDLSYRFRKVLCIFNKTVRWVLSFFILLIMILHVLHLADESGCLVKNLPMQKADACQLMSSSGISSPPCS